MTITVTDFAFSESVFKIVGSLDVYIIAATDLDCSR